MTARIVPPGRAIPWLEAQLAVAEDRRVAQAEAAAREMERRAEDLREQAKLGRKATKAGARVILAQARAAEQAAKQQAKEAGGQPVTLQEPFRPQQIQQTGSALQQAMQSGVPVAQIGGRASPDTTALVEALRGSPSETTTQVPVQMRSGDVWMAPVTTRQQGGLTQGQILQAVLGAAAEARLDREAKERVAADRMDRLGQLMAAGATPEDLKAIQGHENDWYAYPESLKRKVASRYREAAEQTLETEKQKLELGRMRAEAAGNEAEAARYRARAAELEAQYKPEEIEASRGWARVQQLTAVTNLLGKVGAGLIRNGSEAPLSELLNLGPAAKKFTEYQGAQQDISNWLYRMREKDPREWDPAGVYTGLQAPASKLGLVVVKGYKGGTNFFGLPGDVPAFNVIPWETAFETMMLAERSGWSGVTPADLEEAGDKAERQLKDWGLAARADETQGYRLEPVTGTDSMSAVSAAILGAYENRKRLAAEARIPIGPGGMSGALPQGSRQLHDALVQEVFKLLGGR